MPWMCSQGLRFSAVCVAAAGGIALATEASFAQVTPLGGGTAPAAPAAPRVPNPGARAPAAPARAPSISIERFELAGDGCPNRNSTAITAQRMTGGVALQIDFERNQPDRFFQINGPGNQTRSCTARVILAVATSQPMDIALQSARQQVSFINERPDGQLLVRSQFRLNNQTSGVRAFQLVSQNPTTGTGGNMRQVRGANVQLTDIGLRSRAMSPIEVRSVVQLQVLGLNDGAVRVRNLGLDLRLQAVQDEAGDPGDIGMGRDPDPGRAPRPTAPPDPEPVAAPAPPPPPAPMAPAPRAGGSDPIDPPAPGETPAAVDGESAPGSAPGLDTRGFAPR